MGEQSSQQTPASAGRLVALSHDLIGALDREGRLVWANPAWRAVLGRDPAELAGTPYLELLHTRYRALVANLPDTIVTMFDPDLRIIVAEGAQLARRGLDGAAYTGRALADAMPVPARADGR